MKRTTVFGLMLAAAATASAQSIKPRPLGAVQATSKDLFGNPMLGPTLVRALPNGSVIVNDVAQRRLLLLNPAFDGLTVIADSTSGSLNGYGQRNGALIPYVGDSTLFLDVTSSSFLVIDPAGKVTRVMSPPRPADNAAIASIASGFPGFDSKGRMVYRVTTRPVLQQSKDGSLQMPVPADSQPLIRVDLDTRRADTIAYVRTAKFVQNPVTMPDGRTITMSSQVPLATIDDWAVLSDGTIAIVRGRDYRIDFIKPDGNKMSSEKVAFDWKRLNDDDKLAIVDSLTKVRAAGPQGMAAGGPVMMFGGGGGGEGRIAIGGGGGRGDMVITERLAGAAAPAVMPVSPPATSSAPASASSASASSSTAKPGEAPAKAGADSGNATGGPAQPAFSIPAGPPPAIADIPDYMPPFTQISARPDADANLWIRTTTPGAQPGNVVYDVINNQGVLVDRVDVPKGMSIVGFGKGGVVYLTQREGYAYRVLKASVK